MTLPPRSRRGSSLSLLVVVLLTAFSVPGFPQTVREKQLHQMRQVENSNRTVAQFLRSLGIQFKSDTVYVFIVPPMNAARVEGGINAFVGHLRKAGVQADVITLAVFNRRRAAEKYLKRRAFASDHNLVTDERFLTSFAFSTGSLRVPFATKFCVSEGELLSSYSLLGVTDSAAVAAFRADLTKPKAKRQENKRPQTTPVKTEARRPVVGKRLKLQDTDELPLSTFDYVSVNPSGSRLALMDNLTYSVCVFELTTGTLLNALFPDSSEEMRFVSVPASLYQWLKQYNLVTSMYFSHAFLDDTTLMIAASLPNVSVEAAGKDTVLDYRNAPALIKKCISNNRPMGCASLQSLPDMTHGRYSHTEASFACGHGLVFLPFSKGWPSGSQMLDENTPREENPFADEFYQRDVYQFAVFDFDGKFVRLLGRLGDRFEKLRVGYIAGGGLVRFSDGEYYLSDQLSGKIYSYDEEATLTDSITVFDDPPPIFPDVDRSQEPLRYLFETFKQNFKARIVDFLVNDDYCYALVLWDESQPIVHKVGLRDHTTRKYALPAKYQGKVAKHYLLRKTPGGIVTASLLESGDETWYCEFKLP